MTRLPPTSSTGVPINVSVLPVSVTLVPFDVRSPAVIAEPSVIV